jgi:hypothetical protein
MSDTSCPSCNAPASAGARVCARCGYCFVEGGPERAPRPGLGRGVGAAAAVAAAVVVVVLVFGGGDGQPVGDAPVAGLDAPRRLEVISERPLATQDAELLLEERFTALLRDDDSAAVRCSRREPRPAHSLRRCRVRYPTGMERTVVLLTNASGTEVLSER